MNHRLGTKKNLNSRSFNLADYYLDIATHHSNVLSSSLKKFGCCSLQAFLDSFKPGYGKSYQDRQDLYKVLYKYISSLLGEKVAINTIQDLKKVPIVLTANHHGVDYFAQSVQSSLLFSSIIKRLNPSASTIPVFACGNIPLNNLTFPRGLMIYLINPAKLNQVPLKLPIFSDRMKRMVVSAVEPFDSLMIQRTIKRIDKYIKEKKISSTLVSPLKSILNTDYSDPDVLQLDSYSKQSVVMNYRLWKRLFRKPHKAPDIVYLELEEIVSKLLEFDLHNPDSLAWSILFNPHLREKVIGGLNNQKACWNNLKLAGRNKSDLLRSTPRNKIAGCGTHFFWGIDNFNKRIPLYLDRQSPQNPILVGKDDHGKIWTFPFNPSSIIKCLADKRLSPSLFTSYLCLSLARGLNCVGGYYQSEYLPMMQHCVVSALNQIPRYKTMARMVEEVNTSSYLSGMQIVMALIDQGALIPAGPIEIIAGGGLQSDLIAQLESLTVKDAHVASLFETLPDIAPQELNASEWKKNLSTECYRLLKEKIFIPKHKFADLINFD